MNTDQQIAQYVLSFIFLCVFGHIIAAIFQSEEAGKYFRKYIALAFLILLSVILRRFVF